MHRTSGLRDFSLGAARILRRAVPFEGVCVLTMDPATLVPTGEVVEHGLPETAYAQMAEMEMRGEDFNVFRSLAMSRLPAATLSAATDGELDRSRRHRELRAPNGFGDELRALLVDDRATWGALTLLRGDDTAPFTPAEAAQVGSLSRHLAEGVRRSQLVALGADGQLCGDDPAGLVVLAPDNSVVSANDAASAWLEQLGAEPLAPVISAVATRARAVAEGREPDDAVARARVRAPSGSWLLVRASVLGDHPGGEVAVMIEQARPDELAPLMADAFALTERERAVTELVARGLSPDPIAARLYLSPWTVQDHLKSIFEKVGVGTRGELVARLFFDQHEPLL